LQPILFVESIFSRHAPVGPGDIQVLRKSTGIDWRLGKSARIIGGNFKGSEGTIRLIDHNRVVLDGHGDRLPFGTFGQVVLL
jgi:hypothetical protein